MSTQELTLFSYAKINWSLRVLGKRPDGYHEVRTLLQTVSLHDDLHFQSAGNNQIRLCCESPDVPADESNLVVKAARLLQRRHRPDSGATIRLEKRIPPKGGLGGGSSNAAMTLIALADLWNLNLSFVQLMELGSELGADVPFFFVGGRALASGTGTQIIPAPDCAKTNLIIVTPNASVSTSEAYKALNSPALTSGFEARILADSFTEAKLDRSDQWPLHNDFEEVIFEIEPEIKRVQESLLDAGAQGVLLAGSGSSVFGIFKNADIQHRALEVIQAEAGWRMFACDTLSRDEYLRSMGSGGSVLRSSITNFDSGA